MNTRASVPTGTPLAGLLHRLAAATPRLTAEFDIPTNWCIGAAGLTQKVLARNGYQGVRVLGADVAVHSREAWSRLCRRVPRSSGPPRPGRCAPPAPARAMTRAGTGTPWPTSPNGSPAVRHGWLT